MNADSEPLPEVFLRTYGSRDDMGRDGRHLEQRGYVVWFGVSADGFNQAVYVPRERLQESSLRWYFGPVFDEVRSIVNRYDPYGLLYFGAPDDEYEGEISTILLFLRNARSKPSAAKSILQVFTESIGPVSEKQQEAFTQMSHDIWQTWSEHSTG